MCNQQPVLAYEMFAGRELPVTLENLKFAELHFNQLLMVDGNATLNDFYELIDVDLTEAGEQFVWTEPMRLSFDAVLNRAGQPQLRFSYKISPPIHESKVNR